MVKNRSEDRYEREERNAIWGTIVDSMKIMFIEGMKGSMHDLMDLLETRLERMQRNLMVVFAYYFLIALSTIFLGIALINLGVEYLNLSKGWSYLLVGVALIVAAYIIKNKRM